MGYDAGALTKMARRMRLTALEMAYAGGKNGAHLGGGLSAVEIFAVLYGAVARYDPQRPDWPERDRVLPGKAHCVLAYYAALREAGLLSDEDVGSFEQNGTKLVGHPVRDLSKGIEFSGGSLGMALSVGAGMALSARREGSDRRVYVILGDGECQEGSVWEALSFAAKYRLDNLTVIVDDNGLQSDGATAEVGGYDDLDERLAAFGCEVVKADGHDVQSLLDAFERSCPGKPKAIVARTVKGKGVSFIENDYKWHHGVLTQAQYESAVKEVSEASLCRK